MGKPPTAEQLLADADWLRRLAVRLAGDADDAEDLVQESWIAAWARRPDASRPLAPWLWKVMRDRAFMTRRSARRRALRDAAWEAGRSQASPEEMLERVRLQRLLADLVLELPEPYRSTIVARFVEDRSAADIARSLGIPDATVRGRLREGLARLRTQLDEHRAGRKGWAPGVMALADGGLNVAKRSYLSAALVAVLVLLVGGVLVARFLARPLVAGESSAPASTLASAAARTSPPGGLDALLARGRWPAWIAPAGALPRRIAGRVLVEGKARAGVLVRLTSDRSRTGLVAAREVRTTSDGGFDFGPQLAGEVTVSAASPGHLAEILDVDLRDPRVRSDQLELRLGACVAAIHGRVVDAMGTPIVAALLRREDAIGSESDAQGLYELCVPSTPAEPEQLLVVVSADGYGATSTAFAPFGRVRHDFVLTPEAQISGMARGPAGEPVGHAKIWAEPDDAERGHDERPARRLAVTDEHGRFQLDGLAGGRHRLGGVADGLTAPPLVVTVGAGEAREVTLPMLAVGMLRGRVLRDGEPVAGARISVSEDGSSSSVSRADGSFFLDRVPVGEVHFSAAPFRVVAPAVSRVVAGDNPEVTLAVAPLAQLHGTVRRGGVVVPGASVKLFGASKRGIQADGEGRYRIDGLEPGPYSLVADDSALGAYTDGVRFQLALGEDRQLDVELVNAARIVGVIVDEHGAPVPEAHVRFLSEEHDLGRCVTGTKGEFECGQLAGGDYLPSVSPRASGSAPYRFVEEPSRVVVGDRQQRVEGVRLVVHAERKSIRGLVVDPAGHPLADVRVLVATLEGQGAALLGWMPPPAGTTGSDGAFHIEGLAPGTYTLSVRTRDGATSQHNGIAAGTTELRLVVSPSCADPLVLGRQAPRDVQHRPEAPVVWDDTIELVGWSIPAKVRLGEDFDVAFFYKVLAPVGRSWRTFVHIESEQSRLNADHEPLGGGCPMALWQPGDHLVDRFTTRFASDAFAPGTYAVWTGFYIGWVGRWMNMPVSAAPSRGRNERVQVTTIAVEP